MNSTKGTSDEIDKAKPLEITTISTSNPSIKTTIKINQDKPRHTIIKPTYTVRTIFNAGQGIGVIL